MFDSTTETRTITGPNQWSPSNVNNWEAKLAFTAGDLYQSFDSAPFEIFIGAGVGWRGKITVQMCLDKFTAWQDMFQFDGLSQIAQIVPRTATGAFWRIGCKPGDWISGTIPVALRYTNYVYSGECKYDPAYGGMFHTPFQSGDPGLNQSRVEVLPAFRTSDNMYSVVKLSVLPSYIPSPGNVKTISTNFLNSAGVKPVPLPHTPNGFGSIIDGFQRGVMAEDDGAYGSLIVMGGGGYHYQGNEVYRFDYDPASPQGLKWQRISDPSRYTIDVSNGGLWNSADPNNTGPAKWNAVWNEWADGSAGSSQGYDDWDYLPSYSGGGPRGSIVRCETKVGVTGGGSNGAHRFDLTARSIAGWSRASTGLSNGGGQNSYGTAWCWHGSLRKFIGIQAGGGGVPTAVVLYLDFENRPTKGVGAFGSWVVTSYRTMDAPVSRYWPGREVIILFGLQNDGTVSPRWTLQWFDPYNAASQRPPQYLTLTGDVLPYPLPNNGKWGFAYYPPGDCFYARPPGALISDYAQYIWKITPPSYNWRNRPWTVQRIRMGGEPVANGSGWVGPREKIRIQPEDRVSHLD